MNAMILFIKHLYRELDNTDVFGLSAQLAYFFLLSLFPFLLFLITLIGYLPINDNVIIGLLQMYAPTEITSLIEENITALVYTQNGGLLSVSIIGTLWSASNGVNAITKAMNRAYKVEEDRSFLISRVIAIGLTIAMIAVIAVALLLPVFGRMIGVFLFSFVQLSDGFLEIWEMLRWVISSLVIFIVLVALYKLAPNKRVRFSQIIWGALFATFSWQLVSLLFSYYVSTLGNYSATYGSLGTIIVLMIWLYISGMIIIVGGIVNAINSKRF